MTIFRRRSGGSQSRRNGQQPQQGRRNYMNQRSDSSFMSQVKKVGKAVADVYNRLDDKTLDAVAEAITEGFSHLVDTMRPFFEMEKRQVS